MQHVVDSGEVKVSTVMYLVGFVLLATEGRGEYGDDSDDDEPNPLERGHTLKSIKGIEVLDVDADLTEPVPLLSLSYMAAIQRSCPAGLRGEL